MFNATKTAAEGAMFSADAAYRSAKAAEDVIKQNRAWMCVADGSNRELVTNDQKKVVKVIFNIPIKNVGNSPATNVRISAEHHDHVISQELIDKCKLKMSKSGASIVGNNCCLYAQVSVSANDIQVCVEHGIEPKIYICCEYTTIYPGEKYLLEGARKLIFAKPEGAAIGAFTHSINVFGDGDRITKIAIPQNQNPHKTHLKTVT